MKTAAEKLAGVDMWGKTYAELAQEVGVSRQRIHQLLNRRKHLVRQATQYAIKAGKLTRAAQCSACGGKHGRIEAHHDDYDKPMEVRWLCPPCHAAEHPHGKVARSLSYCVDCNDAISHGAMRCRACYLEHRAPPLYSFLCETCGKQFDVTASELRHRRIDPRMRTHHPRYCSRGCVRASPALIEAGKRNLEKGRKMRHSGLTNVAASGD